MQTNVTTHDTDKKQGSAMNGNLNHGSSRKEKQMNAGTKAMSLAGLIALSLALTASAADLDTLAWPSDVPGFVKPAPGEHPRLLFRKADVPALRKKAETPEGRAIIARLRHLLDGNGETFPENVSPATKGYPGPGKYQGLYISEQGYLTIGHAAGYGLLYQLTGDKKYADLGRRAFEKYMEGVRDVDSRYSFVGPNGELRAGPVGPWPRWAMTCATTAGMRSSARRSRRRS